MAQNYKEISAIARKRRDSTLASFYDLSSIDDTNLPNNLTEWSLESGIYQTEEIEIIQSEAEDILQKIRDRIWTSVEVTEAFMKAAAVAHKLVCVYHTQNNIG
jgi:amidase